MTWAGWKCVPSGFDTFLRQCGHIFTDRPEEATLHKTLWSLSGEAKEGGGIELTSSLLAEIISVSTCNGDLACLLSAYRTTVILTINDKMCSMKGLTARRSWDCPLVEVAHQEALSGASM